MNEPKEEEFLYLSDDASIEGKEPAPATILPEQKNKKDDSEPILLPNTDLVTLPDDILKFDWEVSGLDCPDCALKAESSVARLKGVKSVVLSTINGSVCVGLDLSQTSLHRVHSVLKDLGHPSTTEWSKVIGIDSKRFMNAPASNRRELTKRIKVLPGVLDAKWSQGSLLLQLVPHLPKQLHMDLLVSIKTLVGGKPTLKKTESVVLRPDQTKLLGSMVALPILILILLLEAIGASPVLIGIIGVFGLLVGGLRMSLDALYGLKNRNLNFQLLTTVAVIGAAFIQAWHEALLVVLLESLASHLEGAAMQRARIVTEGGLRRIPSTVRVLREIGSKSESVATSLIEKGTLVEVRSGEIIPVDGFIIEGAGEVDKAPLTGEPIPVKVGIDDLVEAGLSLNKGPVILKTENIGDDARLSGLIEESENAKLRNPKVQTSLEIFNRYWIPLTLVGAPLTAFIFGDIRIMLLLWVVACPCALLLSAPLPHATILAQASKKGLILRGGSVIERLAAVNLALLDKTGTLTTGSPRMSVLSLAEGWERSDALSLAAGVERRSNHPYGEVLVALATSEGSKPKRVTNLKDKQGGVLGKLGTKVVRCGKENWLTESGIAIPPQIKALNQEAVKAGQGTALLSLNAEVVALFSFHHDDLREGMPEMVAEFHQSGVSVEILSGDAQPAVEKLGRELGLGPSALRGNLSPEDKEAWVKARSNSHVTLMAGDGFNDALAMAWADVGVAVGSDDSVNLDSADILIPGEGARMLPELFKLSKRGRNIVRQNLLISIIVTALLVAGVVSGWQTNLAIGVLGHEAAALVVILNGLRASKGEVGITTILFGIWIDLFKDAKDSLAILWELLRR